MTVSTYDAEYYYSPDLEADELLTDCGVADNDHTSEKYATVEIMHQIPREEQSLDDGTLTRIEKGRTIRIAHVDYTSTKLVQTITLLGAMHGLVISLCVLSTTLILQTL